MATKKYRGSRTNSSNSIVPFPSVSALSTSSFSCFGDINLPKDFMTSPSSKDEEFRNYVVLCTSYKSSKEILDEIGQKLNQSDLYLGQFS